MRLIRSTTGAALAMVAGMALAQSPYEISGLHTELVFTEAVAQAEKLGGNCQISPSGMQEGGTSAQCVYVVCNTRNQDGACEQRDAEAMGLTIASQPILQIGLEAPGDTARLTRIVFVFDGSHPAVAASLTKAFGPPTDEVAPPDQKSWSHSRRLGWTQGRYRIGLLDIPKMIILAADRTQE